MYPIAIEQPTAFFVAAESRTQLLQLAKDIVSGHSKDQLGNSQLIIESDNLDLLSHESFCIGLMADTLDQFLSGLNQVISALEHGSEREFWSNETGTVFCRCFRESSPKLVAAMFPGQGVQRIGMGKDLFQESKIFREIFETCSLSYASKHGQRLENLVYPQVISIESQERLNKTKNTQPALAAVSSGYFTLFKELGFEPDVSAGHSFGELTAVWAAGGVEDQDYFDLAIHRGVAMETPTHSGAAAPTTMLVVKTKMEKLEKYITDFPEVFYANINAPCQIVVGGLTSDIDELEKRLISDYVPAMKLMVSGAFHTKFMAQAQKQYRNWVDTVKFRSLRHRVYSNCDDELYDSNGDGISNKLIKQLTCTVDFSREVNDMFEDGVRVFIEFGPDNTTANLVRKNLRNKDVAVLSVCEDYRKNGECLIYHAWTFLTTFGATMLPMVGLNVKIFKIQVF